MACFIAPMTSGIITTVFRKKVPATLKIEWLNIMMWGGVLMLVIEHLAHQEVVPYPPFITAGLAEVAPEILSVGVPMTIGIVVVWAILVAITTTRKTKQLSKQ